ncbi:MAG: YceI family protein [Psychrobium sp.]
MTLKTTFIGLCLFASTNVMAAWQLDNSSSSLSYVSTKNSAVAEVNYFTRMQGTVAEQGNAELAIDLTSVETNIPIRNERTKKHLFEVNKFSSAAITTKFDSELLRGLKSGQSVTAKLPFTLTLHGKEQSVDAEVRITKLADRLIVSSMSPIVIYAASFDLVKGIETLRTIAKLPSIATAVPVNFNLSFNKE